MARHAQSAEIVFRKSAITDASLRSLRRLDKLTSIEIFDATLSADGLAELRDLPLKRSSSAAAACATRTWSPLKDTPVENLHLPGNRITETGLLNLGNPPNLRVLGLKATDVGTRLGELKRFPKLRELLLQNAHVTDAGLAGSCRSCRRWKRSNSTRRRSPRRASSTSANARDSSGSGSPTCGSETTTCPTSPACRSSPG